MDCGQGHRRGPCGWSVVSAWQLRLQVREWTECVSGVGFARHVMRPSRVGEPGGEASSQVGRWVPVQKRLRLGQSLGQEGSIIPGPDGQEGLGCL